MSELQCYVITAVQHSDSTIHTYIHTHTHTHTHTFLDQAMEPTPVFLPGESYEQTSLEGYHPLGRKESDKTEATQHIYGLTGGCSGK